MTEGRTWLNRTAGSNDRRVGQDMTEGRTLVKRDGRK